MSLNVFICYAHNDKLYMDELFKHLSVLKRQNLISIKVDVDICSWGGEWENEIIDAIDSCDVAILLLSPEFLASDFIQDHELPLLLDRNKYDGIALLPILTQTCLYRHTAIGKFQVLPGDNISLNSQPMGSEARNEMYVKIAESLLSIINNNQQSYSKIAYKKNNKFKIDIHSLPTLRTLLIGRTSELAFIDKCYRDPKVSIVNIQGSGGIGKTALSEEWLNRMQWQQFNGATRVFGFSFYNQGTHKTYSSSTEFYTAALPFFGYEGEQLPKTEEMKAEWLVELLRTYNSILILDGLETLQYDPYEQEGVFRDTGIQLLLKKLVFPSHPFNGIVITSSRQPLTELEVYRGKSYEQIVLGPMSSQDGGKLLSNLGVNGTKKQLQKCADKWGRQPLALVLLGRLLVEEFSAHIEHCEDLPNWDPSFEKHGQAIRVMKYYSTQFERTYKEEGYFMKVLGLVSRPLKETELNVLLKHNDLSCLLPKYESRDWSRMEYRLDSMGLLYLKIDDNQSKSWDTHPIIRDYFGSTFEKEELQLWKTAHSILFDYFSKKPVIKNPTFCNLEPFFRAVSHGCRAERYIEAFQLRASHILMHDKNFALTKLGAYGADLTALYGFFTQPWTTPVEAGERTGLTERQRTALLGSAGYNLMALGRLKQAISARRSQLELAKKIKHWSAYADAAENLIHLMLLTGDLNEARQIAAEGIKGAKNSTQIFPLEKTKVQYGVAQNRLGDLQGSLTTFKEAEALQALWDNTHPLLPSIQGVRYCLLLLDIQKDSDDIDAIIERANIGFSDAYKNGNIEDMGLYRFIQGLCYQKKGEYYEAIKLLEDSVSNVRATQKNDFLPRVLLARSNLRIETGIFEYALSDIVEAIDISSRSGMRLYLVDSYITRSKYFIDGFYAMPSRTQQNVLTHTIKDVNDDLSSASRLIDETDYHLRQSELMILYARANILQIIQETRFFNEADSKSNSEELLLHTENLIETASQSIDRSGHHGLSQLLSKVKNEYSNISR